MAEVCHNAGQKRGLEFNDLLELKEIKGKRKLSGKLSAELEGIKISISSVWGSQN